MSFQNAKQTGKPGTKTKQAPRPSSVTIEVKGDAPTIGNRTPAPTRTYKNPKLVERSATPGYGASKNLGPSSIEPGMGGGDSTSELAKEGQRVNALGDGGDFLADIAAHGTARNSMVTLQSPETRDLDNKAEGNREAAPVHPAMKRQTTPSKVGDVVVGELPSTLGASAAPQPVDSFVTGKK